MGRLFLTIFTTLIFMDVHYYAIMCTYNVLFFISLIFADAQLSMKTMKIGPSNISCYTVVTLTTSRVLQWQCYVVYKDMYSIEL